MPDKITSTRLAAICGVSQGTVDRALNGRPGIKEETRRRILQKAEELGYVKDMRASGLVRGASWLIGLVLFDLRNEYFAQLASAVEARARALGYTVVLLLTDRDPARERDSVRRLCGLGADGILLCPAGRGEAYEQWLRGLRVPLVTVGNRLSGFPHAGVWEEAAMATLSATPPAGITAASSTSIPPRSRSPASISTPSGGGMRASGPRPPPFLVSKPMWWPSRTIFPPSAP